jgi:hypothetical protein
VVLRKGLPVSHPSAPSISRRGATLQPSMGPISRTIQMGHDKKARAFTAMDLQNASFSTVTAMLYIDPQGDGDWECHGKFTSDNKGHAEEHVLNYLNNDVYYSGDAKVIIELTASPCGTGPNEHNCSGQLIQFKQSEAEERGIAEVSVKALGFYKGSQNAMYDATEMISQGVNFEIWDIRREMTEGPSEGYDNSKSMSNFANAEVYQQPKSGRKTSPMDKSSFNQEKYDKFMGF